MVNICSAELIKYSSLLISSGVLLQLVLWSAIASGLSKSMNSLNDFLRKLNTCLSSLSTFKFNSFRKIFSIELKEVPVYILANIERKPKYLLVKQFDMRSFSECIYCLKNV